MASSASTKSIARRRIRANAQGRKTNDTLEAPDEDDVDVAALDDDAERILSQRIKSGQKKKRRPKSRRSTTQVGLLAAIVIGGIAMIIGLRYIAEMFGVNWIGD